MPVQMRGGIKDLMGYDPLARAFSRFRLPSVAAAPSSSLMPQSAMPQSFAFVVRGLYHTAGRRRPQPSILLIGRGCWGITPVDVIRGGRGGRGGAEPSAVVVRTGARLPAGRPQEEVLAAAALPLRCRLPQPRAGRTR